MANNSYVQNSAIGRCTHCGAIVSFEAGNMLCKCPKCGLSQDRGGSDAADDSARRGGFVPGGNVIPRWPRP